MSRFLVILACVWSLLLACKARPTVRVLPGGNSPKTTERFATFLSIIAGMPYEKAVDIFSRYRMELQRLPGVDYVGLGPDGIIVHTTNPIVVPVAIEGLPVITHPPLPMQPYQDPLAEYPSYTLPRVAGKSYEKAQAIVKRHRTELKQLPNVYGVELGENGALVFLIIHSTDGTINPEALQKASAAIPPVIEGLPTEIRPLAVLPPPPGVVILHADGTREQADSCPADSHEMERLGWRFCLAPGFTGSVPALMSPPTLKFPARCCAE